MSKKQCVMPSHVGIKIRHAKSLAAGFLYADNESNQRSFSRIGAVSSPAKPPNRTALSARALWRANPSHPRAVGFSAAGSDSTGTGAPPGNENTVTSLVNPPAPSCPFSEGSTSPPKTTTNSVPSTSVVVIPATEQGRNAVSDTLVHGTVPAAASGEAVRSYVYMSPFSSPENPLNSRHVRLRAHARMYVCVYTLIFNKSREREREGGREGARAREGERERERESNCV